MIRQILFILPALLILLVPRALYANEAPLTITKIISGDEIALSDGSTVRLEGIKAPKDDRTAIKKLAIGRVALQDAAMDRYGRTEAQVYILPDTGKKVWLQGELLRAGVAFVYPPTGREQNLGSMLRAEAEARDAKRGIWADPAFADISATEAESTYGKFAFVSGRVLDAARIKNKLYLNFGENWREDFTITIAAKDLRLFKKMKIDPLAYKGKKIRVRGWVKREFGPMITVTHPSQIEILRKN